MRSSEDFCKQEELQRSARRGSPKVDVLYESMRPLFKRDEPAIIGANGEAAIRNAIAFARSGTSGVINGGAQAYKVRTPARAEEHPVILSSIEASPEFNTTSDEIYAQPGLLNEAGVEVRILDGQRKQRATRAVSCGARRSRTVSGRRGDQSADIWPGRSSARQGHRSIAQGKNPRTCSSRAVIARLRSQIRRSS